MKIHEIHGHIQSIYLVEYPDRLLLLDSGCRCDVETVEDFAASLGRSLKDLRVVIVTHMHPDHAGGAEVYRRKYGAQIVCHATDEDWYEGWEGRLQHLIDIFLAYWVASRMGRPLRWLWYPKQLAADRQVRDGDRVPGFDDWSVIETPGHTDRDISLLHRESKVLYLADVILKVKGRFIAPFPVEYPELYMKTIEALSRMGLEEILMAHGGRAQPKGPDFQAVLDAFACLPPKRDLFAAILGKLVKVG